MLHETNDVWPMSDQPTNWIYRRHRQLKVDLPHGKQHNEVKRRTRKFICDLYYVPLTMPMETPAARKGCNEITREDVVKFTCFNQRLTVIFPLLLVTTKEQIVDLFCYYVSIHCARILFVKLAVML